MKFTQVIKCMLTVYVAISAGLFLLVACGGSGNSVLPQPPTVVDTTPNVFIFSSQTTTQLSTQIESNSVTIQGVDQAVNISISGGEYRINAGSYTSSSASVNDGDSVTLRLTSSSNVGQTVSATLTVGNISDTFELTTSAIISRVSNTLCIAPERPDTGISGIQIKDAFPNISINSLVGLYQSPNDSSRWYAMSQSGRVYWFDNSATASVLNNVVDLSSLVRHSGERGLLGMAFDPQYATNGKVYFSYINNNSQSIIARLTNTGDFPLNINNSITFLTLEQPASNHNGGQISFGPDGYLYIGFGDGGSSGDAFGNGQNTQTLHSTIMRVDVSGDNYTIPADNPFVNNAGIRDEIYAYGLRNPWRWSFDSQTGELWVGDVGQGEWEEVDLVQAGDNLGWPIMEGNHCYNSGSCDSTGLTPPVAEYNHDSGDCSITGGFVYRGQSIPALQGHFIYGDYCSGTIRTVVKEADQSYTSQTLLSTGLNISSFAQGADGEVLALSLSGKIYRFVDSQPSSSNIPDTLSETGCFESTENKTYPEFVIPFEVKSKLWSDAENKTRLFAIPDNTTISTLDDGDFIFPEQSILIKNFISDGTYLETRLFMKHVTGWIGYSYKWSDDQSDATLVTGFFPEPITVNNIDHTIPSRGQCFECHTSAANTSLGTEASQFDSMITYPNNNQGNQLDALADSGYIATRPNKSQISELVRLDDSEANIATRARSYLHSNCSGCHRPGGPGSQLDFRIQSSLAESMACGQMPQNGDLDINDARIIAVGDASRSVLIARIQTLDTKVRMPPLATEVVHAEAATVLTQWIDGLSSCQLP